MNGPEYLTSQIIAYIGNKRRLLPLIGAALERAFDGRVPPGLKFLDLFAGSGVVSRYAKHRGFSVVSNDWEPYAYILNRAYVEAGERDIERLFGSRSRFLEIIGELNALPDPPEDERYISRYYAPAEDDAEMADFRTERLFYTRANALAIDRIRGGIEKLFPPGDDDAELRRCLLIAPLLYEAATHTNTSGVFKAFHKGFGGHGRDALKRILCPIVLRPPVLIDSSRPCRVFREDAAGVVLRPEASGAAAAYLDPPYNQHQYGSNYHMLTTIALWDKPPAPLDLNEKGVLKNKAAIRRDWVKTRSAYCYAETAAKAFGELLDRLDAERILISYSSDGVVPWRELEALCVRRGRVDIVANSYITYRGGKQSNSRGGANVEFVFIVDTRLRNPAFSGGRGEIERIFTLREVSLLCRRKFRKDALARNFTLLPEGLVAARLGTEEVRLRSRGYFLLDPPDPDGLSRLSPEDLGRLAEKLRDSACASRADELEEIFARLDDEDGAARVRLVPGILKKLAHKKNRDVFFRWLGRTRKLAADRPDLYALVRTEIDAVERIALLRFAG
jgi:adenine-specific DNA-methyltransferase